MFSRTFGARPLLLAAVLVVSLLYVACGRQEPAPIAPASGPETVMPPAPEYIAVLAPGATVLQVKQTYGFEEVDYDESGRIFRFTTTISPEVPEFLVVQPNHTVNLTGPVNGGVWFVEGLPWVDDQYINQEALACLKLPLSQALATGAGTRVVVLDTGVDHLHPHLRTHLYMYDDDNLGTATWERGDFDWHGTHVCGTIASIAPDAEIVPLKVMDGDGVGSTFEVAVGLQSAIDLGADVINMSLSADGDSPVVAYFLTEAEDAGILVVAAAGNYTENREPTFPASHPSAVAVAATIGGPTCTEIDDYSAQGLDVEFAVVGSEVTSAIPCSGTGNPCQGTASGTSTAAACVSGAALLLSERMYLPHSSNMIMRLQNTASEVTGDATVRSGVVDLLEALERSAP